MRARTRSFAGHPNGHADILPPLRLAAKGRYELVHADALEWLSTAPANSVHAVVTDPPYGMVEYEPGELAKLKNGRGGVWRIPPSFDGHPRSPLPRFTTLRESDRAQLRDFFRRLAARLSAVLVPGGHVFLATNPLVSYLVYEPFIAAGFEKRGEIIRVVHTLREATGRRTRTRSSAKSR